MTNTTYKMFLEKNGGSDPTGYIGRVGEMFYDPATGVLRRSDGVTPGGIRLADFGTSGYVGAFHDTTDQLNTSPGSPLSMRLNTATIADGVQVTNNTQIKILHVGNYNIEFSAQFQKTDAGTDFVYIWLSKNGVDIPWTNTGVRLYGNDDQLAAAWNWVVSANPNDYFELKWMSEDGTVFISAHPENTFGTSPGIPSLIVTVTQV